MMVVTCTAIALSLLHRRTLTPLTKGHSPSVTGSGTHDVQVDVASDTVDPGEASDLPDQPVTAGTEQGATHPEPAVEAASNVIPTVEVVPDIEHELMAGPGLDLGDE